VPDSGERLDHLQVVGRVDDQSFSRRGGGGGDKHVRDVKRRVHGEALKQAAAAAFAKQDAERNPVESQVADELRALGVVVTIEGAEAQFPLELDRLDSVNVRKKNKPAQWRLLSVHPATDTSVERAIVWISDDYRAKFMALFDDFLTKQGTKKDGSPGNPKNRVLVANMTTIRSSVLPDLWQSSGEPPTDAKRWWELWLRPGPDSLGLLHTYAEAYQMRVLPQPFQLDAHVVVWVEGTWDNLSAMPYTSVPLTEIRRPQFIDTIEELSPVELQELTNDLVERVVPAPDDAVAVCLVDTGVRRTHNLIAPSLHDDDMHTVVGEPKGDLAGHGTLMAGLALYGPIDELMLSAGAVRLRHRLESVKLLPDKGKTAHDPSVYGVVTAQAVALPEATSNRRRVYCMPISTPADVPGEPSLWSASVDALAVGTDVASSDSGISLLGKPDPSASRLIFIAAGNVSTYKALHLDHSDTEGIDDPAQAWNALTVAASTQLIQTPTDPSFNGWVALAPLGELSPHSRTGVPTAASWPIKPDICMEGGNVLFDGREDFHEGHPLLSVRSLDKAHDGAVSSAAMTSAATAQAARLGALAMDRYPDYWPESVRGLLVHAAEWTPAMRAQLDGATGKGEQLALLKRYGWGVPNEEAVLSSTRNAVTLVTQDSFVPFEGKDHMARRFRLHQLPWPTEVLQEIGEADVRLRVTLSYFIEPTASKRGWRRRFTYPSHGLRFELKNPNAHETIDEFVRRVNRQAQSEEDGTASPTASAGWLVGPRQRNSGSLHQDIWEGSGAELAQAGVLAVHPVGGWWKNNKRADRIELPVRYSLLVSLQTSESVDLYTPIATELRVPVETAIVAQ
jgi:hypothetical protein